MPDESSNMQPRKLALMNPLAGQEEGCRGQTCRHEAGKARVRPMESAALTYTPACVKQTAGGGMQPGSSAQPSVSEGRERRGGEEAREGGDGCVPMADAVVPAETNNTVKKFYSSEK